MTNKLHRGGPSWYRWPSAMVFFLDADNWTDCILWCQSMLGPSGPNQSWNRQGSVFYFKNEQDLTMFTLRWANVCTQKQ